RLRLSVRPRGRAGLYPRNHQDPRCPRHLQGRTRQYLLRQYREADRAQIQRLTRGRKSIRRGGRAVRWRGGGGASPDGRWAITVKLGARMRDRLGIIGLGIMGGAFARNLVGANWPVIGYDIERARCEEARAQGVTIAAGAQAVADAARDIITSLPTPGAALETAKTIAAAKGSRRVG